jgi:L-amino acid N-acyltransferase YncA
MEKTVTERGEGFTVGDLEEKDIADLMPILRQWIRKDGQVIEAEVHGVVERLRNGLRGQNGHICLVVRNRSGSALGVMGFGPVHPEMLCYRSSPDARASGLVTAFVSPDYRGKGLGKSLLRALFDRAGQAGRTEMIWSSNPRYRGTAWPFYTGLAGEPVGMMEGFFEKDIKTPVWRKIL